MPFFFGTRHTSILSYMPLATFDCSLPGYWQRDLDTYKISYCEVELFEKKIFFFIADMFHREINDYCRIYKNRRNM